MNKYRQANVFTTEEGRFKCRLGTAKEERCVMELNANYQNPLNPIGVSEFLF